MTAESPAATNASEAPPPDGTEQPTQGAESAPAASDAGETEKPSDGFTKRIDELTRSYRETERSLRAVERDRDYMREELSRLRRPEPAPEDTPNVGKTLADFAYDESKYQAHLSAEVRKEAAKAAREELTREQQSQTKMERIASHQEREAVFAKDLPDYFEIAHYAPINETMADVIMDSENGPAIAYYLGKNPRVAASIARLPQLQMAREIGRIEATKLADKPKAPQVSSAPPPAPKLAAGESRVEKDPKDMTDAEFAKWRKKFI